MKKIYLYLKTHKKTGLKYLGKTEQDPFKYKGSGVYWTKHLKEHGNDVETEILKECNTAEELKEWGLYYSKLWNIVESDEWANLMEEKGDGISSEQAILFWSNDTRREEHSQKIKEKWDNVEYKSRMSTILNDRWKEESYKNLMSNILKERWENSEYKDFHRQRMCGEDNPMNNPDNKVKVSVAVFNSWHNEESRKKRMEANKKQETIEKKSKAMKKVWEDEEYKQMMSLKRTESNKSKIIYNFVHESGIEEQCTMYDLYTKYNLLQPKVCELVKGTRKKHKGWRLK